MAAKDDTRVVAARIDVDLANRLERVAAADRRTLANLVALVIERALPGLEREVLGQPYTPTTSEKAEVVA